MTESEPGGATIPPPGHIGWGFHGAAHFEGRAARFLARGLARRERLIFVADDPRPSHWPSSLLEQGGLVIASVSELYGAGRLVEPAAQLQTLAGACAEALYDGYTGICVAADNTGLVGTAERLEAWLSWEDVVDEFIASNPLTGLCAFDRSSVPADVLARLLGAHAASLHPD